MPHGVAGRCRSVTPLLYIARVPAVLAAVAVRASPIGADALLEPRPRRYEYASRTAGRQAGTRSREEKRRG
ncbi:hypothetical protein ACU6P3_20205 [Streptomyces hebeiensis]